MNPIDKLLIDKLTNAVANNLAGSFVDDRKISRSKDEIQITLGRSKVYDQKYNSLSRTYTKKTNKQLSTARESFYAFAHWLVNDHLPTLSAKTWELYKSALKAIVLDAKFFELIDVSSPNRKSAIAKRSSAKRLKSLPDQVYSKIVSKISQMDSKYSDVTKRLLFMVRKFGIRPAEIMNCEIVEHKNYKFLRVKSLKKENHFYQNEMADNTYPFRYIPMVHISDDDLEYVRATIFSFSRLESKEIFDSLYEGIRVVFARACQQLNLNTENSTYSIYSARQQFSSDLKVTQLENTTRIRIMSHNEEDTLKNFYGRKSNGKPLFSANAKYESILLECYEVQL